MSNKHNLVLYVDQELAEETRELGFNLSKTVEHHLKHLLTQFSHANSSKGDKRLYEWFELERRYEVPRIAEGKYPKLLYSLHEQKGTLGISDVSQLCPDCDLGMKCPEKQKLTVYCLEGIFMKV
jgi:Post-segregation antitoxin CcdA